LYTETRRVAKTEVIAGLIEEGTGIRMLLAEVRLR
jgi:hypothetical protein